MKKFIILSICVACVCFYSSACGGWGRPNYYMFHICDNGDGEDYPGYADARQFWSNYVGEEMSSWDFYSLGNTNLDEWAKSDNSIIKAIIAKQDYEAEIYVKRLVTYLQAVEGVNHDNWEYPTEKDLNNFNKTMEGLRQQALGYKGSRFSGQYALLIMRTYMAQHKYTENINFWNKTASKMPKNPCSDLMRSIYANALVNTGELDAAAEIYADMHDIESMQWMMRKKRNLAGIKETYNRNPDSPLLPFLIEDFVNNAQETRDSDADKEWIENIGHRVIYDRDVSGFIDFATGIASKKNVKNGAMWLSAAGMLNYLRDNKTLAVNQLENAMKLDGTPAVIDNARRCLILARCAAAGSMTPQLDTWLAGELKWLESQMVVNEHAISAASRIGDDGIMPLIKDNKLYTIAMKGWLGRHNAADWRWEYDGAIDEAASADFNNYQSFIKSKNKSPFETVITEGDNTLEANEFNDLMGTKLLREGKFENAIPYLKKVPLSYLSQQGISRYSTRRDYNVERWFKHQVVDTWDNYYEWGEINPVKVNQKVQYCNDVVALQNKLNSNPNDMETAYRLANLYFQAGLDGDCWYLAHYSWSVTDEMVASEFHFTDEAVALLRKVSKNAKDTKLKNKALYAIAFMPIDYCWSYGWNEKWQLEATDGFNFDALKELAAARRALGKNAPAYMTHCDVLNKFMAQIH